MVESDPEQPCFQFRLAAEGPDRLQCTEKRFLSKVTRLVRILRHSAKHRIDVARVTSYQSVERIGIAVSETFNEVGIGDRVRRGSLGRNGDLTNIFLVKRN
jgi:hypothetical protein